MGLPCDANLGTAQIRNWAGAQAASEKHEAPNGAAMRSELRHGTSLATGLVGKQAIENHNPKWG
eukprot:2699273-Alexandrium_andersonii.AAC.1